MCRYSDRFVDSRWASCSDFSILAEKKEEKDKTDKHRNKSNNVVVVNNHTPFNGDGPHNRLAINGDSATANGTIEDTWIHELFQGTLVSTTKCLNCETVKPHSSDKAFFTERSVPFLRVARPNTDDYSRLQSRWMFSSSCVSTSDANIDCHIAFQKMRPEILLMCSLHVLNWLLFG